MRIGIIEAGEPPPILAPRYGTYGTMIRRLLGDTHAYASFEAFSGDLPEDPLACEAYVISGSACGVNDDLPWIERLADFLRRARGEAKLVGICFGHQVMAHAFGGTVQRAAQGWGLGLHRYDVVQPADWMDGAAAVLALASHQDQVVDLPPDSDVLAASVFTPYAMLAYRDHPSISVQFHPEFSTDFAKALLDLRKPALPPDVYAESAASFGRQPQTERLSRWIGAFLAER